MFISRAYALSYITWIIFYDRNAEELVIIRPQLNTERLLSLIFVSERLKRVLSRKKQFSCRAFCWKTSRTALSVGVVVKRLQNRIVPFDDLRMCEASTPWWHQGQSPWIQTRFCWTSAWKETASFQNGQTEGILYQHMKPFSKLSRQKVPEVLSCHQHTIL